MKERVQPVLELYPDHWMALECTISLGGRPTLLFRHLCLDRHIEQAQRTDERIGEEITYQKIQLDSRAAKMCKTWSVVRN